MNDRDNRVGAGEFWGLAHLSDAQVTAGVEQWLGATRRSTARLLAHLAEIEERRLHLRAACSSMFVYCTRLGMSEDEACRRIEAARLARRFPAAFPLLDTGALSLTVLCLLKELATPDNHAELLAGVAGKSVKDAREWLAGRFPRPDVAPSIRKLPEPAAAAAPAPLASEPLLVVGPTLGIGSSADGMVDSVNRNSAPCSDVPAPAPARIAPGATDAGVATGPRVEAPRPVRGRDGRVEPLSEGRYRVQFTASRALKDKLELARDLLAHVQPGADLDVIVERAVDLLVADLMKKRFGQTSRPRGARRKESGAPAAAASTTDRVSTPARRAVVERDGLACTYVDEHGRRCGARALLEIDHRDPRALGGSSETPNLRVLCKAHNGLEAERQLGRKLVERCIARRRARKRSRGLA